MNNDQLARSPIADSAGVEVSVLLSHGSSDSGEIVEGCGRRSVAIVYLQILLTSMAARDRG